MAQVNPDSYINYIHLHPESFRSIYLKFLRRFAGMKKQLERDITTGGFDQDPAPVPASLRTHYQMEVSELDGRLIWRFQPKQHVSDQVVLFLHGGAYIYNISAEQWGFIEQLLQKTAATFLVPDYPLAPQAPCLETFAFVQSIYEGLLATTSSGKVIYMGDSAGAGLALGLAQSLRNQGKPLPRELILVSPWLDVTMSNPQLKALDRKDKILGIAGLRRVGAVYAGPLDPQDYRVSPIYGDFEGLPEISLLTGTHDLCFEDVQKLKNILRSADLPLNYFEYPKMVHDWVLVADQKESIHAIDQITKLILQKD